ncbi:MAG: hypothetical protein U1C73_20695, partial [Dietzia sp.]|nr:hypothetical protein [Dietzia sp.]
TSPGGTEPSTPGEVETTTTGGQVSQPTTGSTEPAPTEVPTAPGTVESEPPAAQNSVLPPFGWRGSFGSEQLPALPWPAPTS